jgi:hypothetical protein
LAVIVSISAMTFSRGRRDAAGQSGGQLIEFAAGLGQRDPGEPEGLALVQFG